MTTLLWLLAILAAGAALLLSVPVELRFHVERTGGAAKAKATLAWMFGRVQVPLSGRGGKDRRRKSPKKEKKRSRFTGAKFRAFISSDFLARTGQFLWSTLRAIRWGGFGVRMRIGLEDPADTGFLWSAIGPLTVMLPRRNCTQFDIQPEFNGPLLDVAARGHVRVIPAEVIGIVLAFCLSPATLRTLWRVTRA